MAVTSFKTSSMTTGSKRARVWDQSSSPGNFFNIATTTVGAGGASEILFSNIPQIYTNLQIRYFARVATSSYMSLTAQFNSDTGANYFNSHYLYGDGSTIASATDVNTTFLSIGTLVGSSVTANVFASGIVDILDYSNTNKFKTTRAFTGSDTNGGGYCFIAGAHWRSTAGINSIKIMSQSNYTFSQNTKIALYGEL